MQLLNPSLATDRNSFSSPSTVLSMAFQHIGPIEVNLADLKSVPPLRPLKL